jgi:hypothetical protein
MKKMIIGALVLIAGSAISTYAADAVSTPSLVRHILTCDIGKYHISINDNQGTGLNRTSNPEAVITVAGDKGAPIKYELVPGPSCGQACPATHSYLDKDTRGQEFSVTVTDLSDGTVKGTGVSLRDHGLHLIENQDCE